MTVKYTHDFSARLKSADRKLYKYESNSHKEVTELVKPSIKDQILIVESAIENFPKYNKILSLHKGVLKILLPLDESQKRGANIFLTNESLKKILNKTLSSKNPISYFFSESDFNLSIILDVAKDIAKLLIEANANDDGLRHFFETMEENALATEAIDSILKENPNWFKNQSDKFGVEPSLILLIFDSPLRPFFEEIARKVEEKIKETWLEPYCPVCGRKSTVAKNKQLKRYMICSYCGTEYLVDMFECINCGNNDPTSMAFINIKGFFGYELNYCEKCNHYLKILDDDKILGKIPSGLEDLLTRELDNIAILSDLNLKRS